MKEISIHEININPATMFGKEWCLSAAGTYYKNIQTGGYINGRKTLS